MCFKHFGCRTSLQLATVPSVMITLPSNVHLWVFIYDRANFNSLFFLSKYSKFKPNESRQRRQKFRRYTLYIQSLYLVDLFRFFMKNNTHWIFGDMMVERLKISVSLIYKAELQHSDDLKMLHLVRSRTDWQTWRV